MDKPDVNRDLAALKKIICRLLGLQAIVDDQDIYHAGVTSIMILPLLSEIEDAFNVTIPDTLFLDARTPRALVELICQSRCGSVG